MFVGYLARRNIFLAQIKPSEDKSIHAGHGVRRKTPNVHFRQGDSDGAMYKRVSRNLCVCLARFRVPNKIRFRFQEYRHSCDRRRFERWQSNQFVDSDSPCAILPTFHGVAWFGKAWRDSFESGFFGGCCRCGTRHFLFRLHVRRRL